MRFMDFCSGIGGGRLGLSLNGAECVGYSEIDKEAIKTYTLFYGDKEKNFGDLMTLNVNELPDFDIMIAGFPCQTFSVLGKRKGFNDERGQVIYGLLNILKVKNVPYFILENVKGLVNHNGGKTLKVILSELNSLGYYVDYKVLNSLYYGVPQMRERIYIIGIKNEKFNNHFVWPEKEEIPSIKEYFCEKELFDQHNETWLNYLNNKYNKGRYNLEELLNEDYLVIDTRQSDLRLYRDKIPTLRTGRHGILYVKNHQMYKLSGYESLLFQGFPKDIAIKVVNKIPTKTVLSQAGNAMTVSVMRLLGKSLMECINGQF